MLVTHDEAIGDRADRKIVLKDGKIIEQRDYYDLWGDILDTIKFVRRGYRRFMSRRFG